MAIVSVIIVVLFLWRQQSPFPKKLLRLGIVVTIVLAADDLYRFWHLRLDTEDYDKVVWYYWFLLHVAASVTALAVLAARWRRIT